MLNRPTKENETENIIHKIEILKQIIVKAKTKKSIGFLQKVTINDFFSETIPEKPQHQDGIKKKLKGKEFF